MGSELCICYKTIFSVFSKHLPELQMPRKEMLKLECLSPLFLLYTLLTLSINCVQVYTCPPVYHLLNYLFFFLTMTVPDLS
jgi:hypothetical protein